jgi:hypothetical protein
MDLAPDLIQGFREVDGEEPTVVRVEQGKEPAALLLLLSCTLFFHF